jgi:ribosomal protein L12E/L44/L45/RPP1/RPP2
MRYTAAYLLAILGGNPAPDVAAIAKILGSVGIECDEKRAQQVVDACHGKNVDDIIAKGMEKIENVALANTSGVALPTIDDEKHDSSKENEPKANGSTSVCDSEPSSPSQEPGLVSLYCYLTIVIFIDMFLYSSTYSHDEQISTHVKSQSKQELHVTILLSFFFCYSIKTIKQINQTRMKLFKFE